MAYWILLALYLLLVLLYAFHYKHPTVQKWPLLPKIADISTKPASCQDTKDCPPYHICVNQQCVPQLLRGEECNAETGDWTLVEHHGKPFTACVCKDPNIVNQKYFGGNCDQDVACHPYGHYNLHTKQCVCDKGFQAYGLKCVTLMAKDRMIREPCEAEEVKFKDLSAGQGFTHTYINKNRDKPCFKRPCTFDAWTGKFLKKARYERDVGCLCDPTLGQFGVRLEGLDSYMKGDGYNACVSAFETPLETSISVQIFAYFYLMDTPPVVFIQYSNIKPNDVIEPLRHLIKDNTLQIGQEFPYDYLQAHLRKREPFWTRTRTISFDKNFYMYSYIVKMTAKTETRMTPNAMEWCRYMSRHLRTNRVYEWSFNLLSKFPMCYVGKTDDKSPKQYRGRYVLNPFQLLHTDLKQGLDRTNGVVFTFEEGKWVLSLTDDDYDVDTYHLGANASFIPDVTDDPVASMLQATGIAGRDAFILVQSAYDATSDERLRNNEPTF